MSRHRKHFESWRSDKEFDRAICELADSIESADLVCKGDLKWILESQIAAKFAFKLQAKWVRLVPEFIWSPDFELKLNNGKFLEFRLTETVLEAPPRREVSQGETV